MKKMIYALICVCLVFTACTENNQFQDDDEWPLTEAFDYESATKLRKLLKCEKDAANHSAQVLSIWGITKIKDLEIVDYPYGERRADDDAIFVEIRAQDDTMFYITFTSWGTPLTCRKYSWDREVVAHVSP
jgi:hypothetical protein